MAGSVLESLRQLVHSWWRIDRVRVAKCTGRLLELVPGDRLLVLGQLWLVIGRIEYPIDQEGAPIDSARRSGVVYELRNQVVEYSGRCCLHVLLGEKGLERVWLETEERGQSLWEDEIVVLDG
ncbi:MAG: hypothetical protein IT423_18080 [Pirellulaceae bacterium]|nr:hypothetical protein [Pirellulaceae bacterium]